MISQQEICKCKNCLMINIQGRKLNKRTIYQHKKAEKYLYDKTDEYENLDVCEKLNEYNELNINNEELDYDILDELKVLEHKELEQEQIVSIDELVQNIE
ncbi:39673_t:CDS:2, partial [Gigaspora margarita]